MTNEEAIEFGNMWLQINEDCKDSSTYAFFQMAIKALEQQPCEDAINREDALMALTGEWTEITDEIIHRFIKRIKKLPPVTSQPKIGHWIRVDKDKCKCDKCEVISFIAMYPNGDKNYCPNCGAKMQEVEE